MSRDAACSTRGCGPGFYTADLIDRGGEALGCDDSPRMVELARARVNGAADLRVHALEDPFEGWTPRASTWSSAPWCTTTQTTDRLPRVRPTGCSDPME